MDFLSFVNFSSESLSLMVVLGTSQTALRNILVELFDFKERREKIPLRFKQKNLVTCKEKKNILLPAILIV